MITSSVLLEDHPSHLRLDYPREALLVPILEVAWAVVDFQSLAALSEERQQEAVAFQAFPEEGACQTSLVEPALLQAMEVVA